MSVNLNDHTGSAGFTSDRRCIFGRVSPGECRSSPRTWLLRALFCCLALGLEAGCAHTGIYLGPTERQFAQPPQSEVKQRVLLIGDAGEINEYSQAVLAILETRAIEHPDRTVTIFLGDNIYERGMPPDTTHPDYFTSIFTIQSQLDVLNNSKTRGLFVTGNHDWGMNFWRIAFSFFFQDDRRERVLAQAEYIESVSSGWSGGGSAALVPKPKPKPVLLEEWSVLYQEAANPHIMLVDTQLLLFKKRLQDINNENLVAMKQGDAIGANKQVLILAGHHPINTYGVHGGIVKWHPLLAPFQFILAIPQWLGITKQDLTNPQNKKMVRILKGLMKKEGALIYASGHDHSLQVLKNDDDPYIMLISGSGSKTSAVGYGDDTLFASQQSGIMEVDLLMNDGVYLRVFIPDENGRSILIYSRWLRPPTGVQVQSASSRRSISRRRRLSTGRSASLSSTSRRSSLLSAPSTASPFGNENS